MRRVLIIPILILAGLVVFAVTSRPQQSPPATASISGATPALRSAQAYLLPVENPAYAPVRDTLVPEPQVDAHAVLVMHMESGKTLYEKNPSVQVPIASLTKVLSAFVAQDLFDQNEIITVASSAVRVDGQKQTLYTGERIAAGDLVSMMLVESSNDAAYALAAYAKTRNIDFVSAMNQKAALLGMDHCRFTDPAGLDDLAFCDANDLLRLTRATLRNAPQLWPIMAQAQLTIRSVDGAIVHEVKSTDELLGQLEGVIGGKTGYTDGALGCMLLVVKLPENRGTLISIVLGSRTRFMDTTTLVSWVRQAYRWY